MEPTKLIECTNHPKILIVLSSIAILGLSKALALPESFLPFYFTDVLNDYLRLLLLLFV